MENKIKIQKGGKTLLEIKNANADDLAVWERISAVHGYTLKKMSVFQLRRINIEKAHVCC
ncbi:hypothetical protein E2P30_00720 [Candidatus Bathyarchaeota archaeon]|nr:hypothetical protein E2P30_00720 [Candidatus Bathyarchaeota archaeon]